MKKIALLVLVTGTLFSSVNVKSLDIFTNRSFVNQEINTNLNSVDLLEKVRLEDIRFTLNQDCSVNNVEVKYVDFGNDNLASQIERLKEKIDQNQNQIKALKSNISFLEKTSITSISNAKNLKDTSKFIKQEILENHNKIYNINNELKKLNQDLALLNKKRVNSNFTRLNYDIRCSKTESLIITYPIYNILRNGFYEINYNSKAQKLDIKNSSFITQSTGADFKNIDVNLYTYNFIQQLKPNNFYPKYLDIYSKIAGYIKNEVVREETSDDKKMLNSKEFSKPTFAYIEDTTKSFFKASNINLISGKKAEVLFAKDSYKAEDSLVIDGYSLSQAFYKVKFKSKKLYGVLNSKLYLDSTYIGRARQNEIKKDKDSFIFFGTNRFIDVKKELIKDMKEKPFFSINKLKSQKIWKYTIINNHIKTQKLTLVERVPISKHKDIKVKLIGKDKYTKLDKNGKISFEFKLKPNEEKIIEFGYEVEKPN